ncbi:MAG TPA: hypothetical protein VLG47_07615 [Candidatus Saccharimonadales bacterium]|nr:hypothetical protein [Candidatus Saccharimonadales bacterium]
MDPHFLSKVHASQDTRSRLFTLMVLVPVFIFSGFVGITFKQRPKALAAVPGQSYNICDQPSQLTSPWPYHALASGSQSYTVSQYQALTGYGTTLPPLPSYIIAEGASAPAAVIYAPGSSVSNPAYNYPQSPIIHFFEGGSYGFLGLQSVTGDEFIGGSTTGFNEPQFDDANGAGGIGAGNDTYSFSGGSSTLAATANIGATTVTTNSPISDYSTKITFSDGKTYGIAGGTSTSIQLDSALTSSEAAGSQEWTNSNAPVSKVSSSAAQGATTVSVSSSTIPLLKYGHVAIGDQDYEINDITGTQSGGYTLTITRGLDMAAAVNTPVYYGASFPGAGAVTVSYLDISHDLHVTTGTLTPGQGWEISHNYIHDSYRNPGEGVALYGGDQDTVEYNCFSKMGNYAAGGDGVNAVFRRNEVFQTPYTADPGCGCSGVGKWWGSLNADIVDNYFTQNGIGEGQPVIWLDNGNSGTNISGNYFYKNQGTDVESETGFNVSVTNNLFVNDNWGTGSGCGNSNCSGAVNLNSSGGFDVANSRYNNQVIVSGNQFINDWGGVTIWQATLRSCLSSGEGWPIDSAYCSGGYPTSQTAAANGQYYFSHVRDSAHGDTFRSDQTASAGSTSLLVGGGVAINDQIGVGDPALTTTTSTTDVASLSGSQTINAASTTGFPSSGKLRVDTSSANGGGGYTGAILSYTGTTATSFTGVSRVRGSGTLTGAIQQVQPYQVTAETCYANNCKLTITPALTSSIPAGTALSGAGTCALFDTAGATPTSPLAPDGTSYFDGCQWGTKHISVTGNSFDVDPSYINSQTALNGNATNCTVGNECGTNFMMYQGGNGMQPMNNSIIGNSMYSNSTFTGCPGWDSGCSANPLKNLNALSNPPDAPANNNEPPNNNLWSNNAYYGPWTFNAYNYGPCASLPSDTTTGKSMPTNPDPCQNLSFATWQSDWQQDTSSSFTSTPNPNPPPPAGKTGDFNSDGNVNITDLSMLLTAYGTNNATILTNLNQTGTVNITCLSIFLSHWNT